eukprot:TRINITY_DN3479_c0_g4_i1.p1 TRINITY_DN3479_c0_g4~~TRINITY_DN3479_c0_g4_i1.p1  ORF type:complete len:411 (+),score=76.99 TRINITY_DN3479_c0_g4_i1:609-1841(+)
MDVRDYPYLFYRLAETFPDFLFVTCQENDTTKCWIYTHGAIEYGYNPKGFLCKPDVRFQCIDMYNRQWFYDHVRTSDPRMMEKLSSCRDFGSIPISVAPSTDGVSTGCGPTWNYHHNGEMVARGSYGHGIFLNRTMLQLIFDAWASSEEGHYQRNRPGASHWVLRRMQEAVIGPQPAFPVSITASSSSLPATATSSHTQLLQNGNATANRASESHIQTLANLSTPRLVVRVCIGGHEHANVKDVLFLTQAQRQHGVGFLWNVDSSETFSPLQTRAFKQYHSSVLTAQSSASQGQTESSCSQSDSSSVQVSPTLSSASLGGTPRDRAPYDISYMVYKFFNMLDLVYYRLPSVSNGRLLVRRENGFVVDKIQAQIIPDTNQLYANRVLLQQAFDDSTSLKETAKENKIEALA